MSDWTLMPGDVTTRREVADAYGGATQGGIQPSARTQNVFVYVDPTAGEQHGYAFDGWADDGAFYYSGEGQVGDQVLTKGNAAIANHVADGRALRVFEAVGSGPGGKRQRYLGEFAVDPADPYRTETGPDRNGNPRAVLVFRLIPHGAVETRSSLTPAVTPHTESKRAQLVSTETNLATEFPVSAVEEHQGRRWEADLMARVENLLTEQGRTVRRWRIQPAGETSPMFTDLFSVEDNELFELKPDASRTHIREAVAQLLDYRRHLDNTIRCTVLVPVTPSQDLRNYIRDTGLHLAVFADDTIVRN